MKRESVPSIGLRSGSDDDPVDPSGVKRERKPPPGTESTVVSRISLRQIHGTVTNSELQQLHNEISKQSLLLNNIR